MLELRFADFGGGCRFRLRGGAGSLCRCSMVGRSRGIDAMRVLIKVLSFRFERTV